MPFDNSFQHMRVQDRAKADGIRYPFFHLFPMRITSTFIPSSNRMMVNYNCAIAILELDKDDSTPDEQRQIIQQTDLYCNQYVLKLNEKVLEAQEFNDTVDVTNITWEPVFRITTDITTGHLLSFTLTVPDDFNFC